MRRRCPDCGAYLDPGEICDCIEKAAPELEPLEAAQVNDFIYDYSEISFKSQGGKINAEKVERNAER